MSRPLVSVIMNCYNGATYLRQAIDSVLTQTWDNWEIIFWDNQSTDDSAMIVKSYEDKRIKYFYAPSHTWLYEARNYAIAYASGDYLAFLDVDDWWLPEKLERQLDLFIDPEVAVVCSNYWVENENKNKRWKAFNKPLPTGKILELLLKDYSIALLTLMLRRAVLPCQQAPFDPRYHIIGDYDLVIRLASVWKVGAVQDPMAVYRIHGGNETAKRRERHIEELECWQGEHANSFAVNSGNFHYVAANIAYIKGINASMTGRKKEVLSCLYGVPWSKLKFRLLIALLLPPSLVKRIKN